MASLKEIIGAKHLTNAPATMLSDIRRSIELARWEELGRVREFGEGLPIVRRGRPPEGYHFSIEDDILHAEAVKILRTEGRAKHCLLIAYGMALAIEIIDRQIANIKAAEEALNKEEADDNDAI